MTEAEDELRRLILEQAKDDKWGRRCWPEWSGIQSLDAFQSMGIELDQDGHLIRRNNQFMRNAPKRTRSHHKPWNTGLRKPDCATHPGEGRRDKRTDKFYCLGHVRERQRRYRARFKAYAQDGHSLTVR